MTDWNKLKVVDLKAELKQRGLSQTGLKPVLVARLVEAEKEEGSESEATLQGEAKLDASSTTSPDTVSPVVPSDGGVDLLTHSSNETPELVEQAVAQDVTQDVTQDISIIQTQTEDVQTTSIIDYAQPSDQSESHRSDLPSVDPQEAMEDRQKRKRRSQSPPPSGANSIRKRLRTDDETADSGGSIELANARDDELAGEKNVIDPVAIHMGAEDASDEARDFSTPIENARTRNNDTNEASAEGKADDEQGPRESGNSASKHERHPSSEQYPGVQKSRFKTLFGEASQGAETAVSKSVEPVASEDGEPDRMISPAIHPATSGLYIRDLLRPLNPVQFKAYLSTLATPPGQVSDGSLMQFFYLDPIRTHAFVSFANISAASRVRSALHDRVWPEEKNRKPLWVDFVPSSKIEEWIRQEEAANAVKGVMAKKWEVYYSFDEDDGHVSASLQEATSQHRAKPYPTRRPSIPVLPPQGVQRRQSSQSAASGPQRSFNIRGQAPAPTTARLDELFKSTTTKPVLYWMPVSKDLANKRLDNIDSVLSKDAKAGLRIDGPINRYTFEDGDTLVDRGAEIFPTIRPPPDYRRGGEGRGRDHGRDYGRDSARQRGGSGGYRGRNRFGGGEQRDFGGYQGGGRFGGRGDRSGGGYGGGYGGGPDRHHETFRSERRDSRDYGRY